MTVPGAVPVTPFQHCLSLFLHGCNKKYSDKKQFMERRFGFGIFFFFGCLFWLTALSTDHHGEEARQHQLEGHPPCIQCQEPVQQMHALLSFFSIYTVKDLKEMAPPSLHGVFLL